MLPAKQRTPEPTCTDSDTSGRIDPEMVPRVFNFNRPCLNELQKWTGQESHNILD